MKAPCKDCENRKVLCHESCQKYKSYKEQYLTLKHEDRLKKIARYWTTSKIRVYNDWLKSRDNKWRNGK